MQPKFCSQISGVDLDGKLVKIACQGHDCEHYVHILGFDPQTEEPVDQWGCAFNAQWYTQLQTAKITRQVGKEVEVLRDAQHRHNGKFMQFLAEASERQRLGNESNDR